MALFKIFRGNSLTLPKTYKDGYCYFTIDDGKMYIDTKDNDSTSEIPDYDTWGQNPVKVNNRIWIKVK